MSHKKHIDSELPKVLFKVLFFGKRTFLGTILGTFKSARTFLGTFLEHFLKHFIENFFGGNELFWALFNVLLKVLELFGALF